MILSHRMGQKIKLQTLVHIFTKYCSILHTKFCTIVLVYRKSFWNWIWKVVASLHKDITGTA